MYVKIKTRGFSLIEVLISLVLFTSLSLSMMNVLNQVTRSEKQMEKLIRESRMVQNLTHAIKKDLQSIIYILPRDIPDLSYSHYFLHLKDTYQADYYENYFPIENQEFIRHPAIPAPKVGFIGDEESFYFTSPFSTDSNFSTLQVGYVVEPCPNQGRTQCLIRKTTTMDQDLSFDWWNDKFEKRQVLIENIQNFQVQYFFKEEWKSEFKIPYSKGLVFPLPLPIALRVIIERKEKDDIDFYVPFHSTLLSNKITRPKMFTIKKPKPTSDKESK